MINKINLSKKAKDITGSKFGRLTAIAPIGKVPRRQTYIWRCKCICGSYKDVRLDSLTSGKTVSCGCYHKEMVSTHKRSRTPEYRCWMSMLGRCNNPKYKGFKRYGGRGIEVCDRWSKSFDPFIEDMGERPTPSHSIDRIDNNGHYCPENCRWATKKQQSRNTRTNKIVTFNGRTMTVSEWAEETGIARGTIFNRIARGWTIERLLTTP